MISCLTNHPVVIGRFLYLLWQRQHGCWPSAASPLERSQRRSRNRRYKSTLKSGTDIKNSTKKQHCSAVTAALNGTTLHPANASYLLRIARSFLLRTEKIIFYYLEDRSFCSGWERNHSSSRLSNQHCPVLPKDRANQHHGAALSGYICGNEVKSCSYAV